jgi:hypothetical protein
VIARLRPEVEWNEPGGGKAPSGTFKGPDSVANDLFARVPEQFEDFQAIAEDARAEGEDKVIVTGRFKGRSKSGVDMDVPCRQEWEIRDGKIAKLTNSVDDPEGWAEAWS